MCPRAPASCLFAGKMKLFSQLFGIIIPLNPQYSSVAKRRLLHSEKTFVEEIFMEIFKLQVQKCTLKQYLTSMGHFNLIRLAHAHIALVELKVVAVNTDQKPQLAIG